MTAPDRVPSRRRSDRPTGDFQKVLLVALGESPSEDLETWARSAFTAEVVADPLEAVAILQRGSSFGGVLVNAPRKRLRDAVQACRAFRPLTGAAIVFASDDAIRSTDRVSLLEAGADDCLSGGVDFRELEARLKQAVVVGGKQASAVELSSSGRGFSTGGRVPRDVLANEAQRRVRDPKLSVFSMVRLTSPVVQARDLEGSLAEEIRDEDGDLITCTSEGCIVLLQGARWDPAQAFISRFRSELEKRIGHDPALKTEILTYPAEKREIEGLLDRLKDVRAEQIPSADPEGSDGQRA